MNVRKSDTLYKKKKMFDFKPLLKKRKEKKKTSNQFGAIFSNLVYEKLYMITNFKNLMVELQISYCGRSKTWALAVGLSTTFYQQYVRGEEIIREPRN